MSNELKENAVQHTLCIPLWGRMIAARKYPNLFPDQDAERIVIGFMLHVEFKK